MFTLVVYGVLIGVFTTVLFKNSKNLFLVKDLLTYLIVGLMIVGTISAVITSSIIIKLVMISMTLGWLYVYFHFHNYEESDFEKIFDYFQKNNKTNNTLSKFMNYVETFDIMEKYEKLLTISPFGSIMAMIKKKKETISPFEEDNFWFSNNRNIANEILRKRNSIPDMENIPEPPKWRSETKSFEEFIQGEMETETFTIEEEEEVVPEEFFNLNQKKDKEDENTLTPEQIRIKKIQDLFSKN